MCGYRPMAGLILHEGCCGYTAAGECSQKGVGVSYSLAWSSARSELSADSLSRVNVRHATILYKYCALPRGESSVENILWKAYSIGGERSLRFRAQVVKSTCFEHSIAWDPHFCRRFHRSSALLTSSTCRCDDFCVIRLKVFAGMSLSSLNWICCP